MPRGCRENLAQKFPGLLFRDTPVVAVRNETQPYLSWRMNSVS